MKKIKYLLKEVLLYVCKGDRIKWVESVNEMNYVLRNILADCY